MTEATTQRERSWEEISACYEYVDLGEAKRRAAEYTEILLKLPEVKRALDLIREKLNDEYRGINFPEQEEDPAQGMKLPYHNVEHSEDVFRTAIYMAVVEAKAKGKEIDEQELLLLGLMAIYHDTGFIVRYQKNEDDGASIVTRELLAENYKFEHVSYVANGVKATKVDQLHGFKQNVTDASPASYKILCDADVRNFGGADHEIASRNFSREFNTMNFTPVPEPGSLGMQTNYRYRLQLLNDHRWNSDVGYFLFERQKRKNIEFLQRQLGVLK